MKIKTKVLQEMIEKAVHGASNNKIIPITSLISLVVKDGILTMTTTDVNNQLKIFQSVEAGDFEAVVPLDVFSKLVAKTTSKEMEFEVEEQVLHVKGNGTYKIPLPVDEEGEAVHFPIRTIEQEKAHMIELSEKEISSVIEANKPAVAITVEIPYLTGYYFDKEKVITTNAFVVCVNRKALFNKIVLLPSEFVELLPVIGEKSVSVYMTEKSVYAVSEYGSVYGHYLEGLDDFPIDAINEYIESEFQSSVVIDKEEFENVLDRMGLFVEDYDKNAINISFLEDRMELKSKKSTGVETINYKEGKGEDYEITIDINLLKKQLEGHSKKSIELHYGNDRAVKLSSGDVIHLIALFEEE